MVVHDLRLQAADGIMEVKICDDCARFWDVSAEVLSKGRKKDNDSGGNI